ncbi:MAG: glycosyltransferase family 4 protein [bacterium]|nr:glycosyltransferase family 4 protein [bacterium]
MRIAINTRFLLPHKMEGFGWYTYEITKRLVEQHPDVTFILFFDRKYDSKFVFGDNVIPVVLSPQARHPILFKIWFNQSVKRALKKYKADIFLSPDGYLSLTTDVKQVAVMHDLNFVHNPQDLKPVMRRYYLTQFPKFAKKASHIITVSEYSKQDICEQYQVPEDRVTAIWNGASEVFQPLKEGEIQSVRDKYSGGLPYFLFVGAIHPRKNVRRLIEAFALFRENNSSSNMPLVIVGTELWANAGMDIEISDELKSSIRFTGHLPLEELALVMGAADIFAFVPYFEGFGIPLVEAMRCGTPILAGDKTSLPEVAGDAALYCDPFSVEDIALKMTELANNDALRNDLSSKGLERSKLFSWDSAAEKVWNVLKDQLDSH